MKTTLHDLLATEGVPFKPHPPRPASPAESLKHFRIEMDADQLAWITFDMVGSSANVWNDATLHEFGTCLDLVRSHPNLRAVILRSAKEKITVAGADLKALRQAPARKLERLIRLGQDLFTQLSELPMTKICLIHGACLGGGFEMALACDVRIASDSGQTNVGLPETLLGLIPAWGGSTRLPRLIGLAKAMDLVVKGKSLGAHAAKKQGLVDAVVPREHLETEARRWVGHRPSARRRFEPKVWRWFIAHRARQAVMKRTRGLYLAPLRAIDVLSQAPYLSHDRAMECERHAILDLTLSPETCSLMDVFLRREEANKKPWTSGVALPVNEVAVIGAGIMGAGITHWLASRGKRVLLQDVSHESLARGLTRIHGLLSDAKQRRLIRDLDVRHILDRITPTPTPVPLLHHALVIEAATEDMALKKKIFADLASRCSHDTVLATNTSALSVTELARDLPHPERVIGLHFFNPVHRMPLVEVIITEHTTPDVIATAVTLVQQLGKTPLVVRDSPGFIVNRILMPYLLEAVHLHDSGVPPELIDEAMLDFGMPMGPIRLLDEIGLDVAAHVGRTMTEAFPERMPRSATLDQWISAGKLGRKSGAGFYSYPESHKPRTWSEPDHRLMERIQERLVGLIRDEARRCQLEGIARSASDIELAMILGTGFPAFRSLQLPPHPDHEN